MKLFQIVLISVFLLLSSSFRANAQGPGSSPQWVNFWSVNSDVIVGDVVRVYDSAGVLCGESFVDVARSYGFLACALDDPNTSIDEGVVPGDSIHFTINNVPVSPKFTLPLSLYNGMSFEVNLGATSDENASPISCIDGYENDDTKDLANSITGPEAHTFYSQKHAWDRDWGTFTAKAGYIYQIQARSSQSFAITHPVLYLYDAKGVELSQSDLDKWGRGAEIWWQNNTEKDLAVYLVVEEKNGQYGCRHYTLTVIPWTSAEFALRFKQQ